MRFTNIESLKKYLEHDANTPDLFPVRYINVETMELWVELKAFLSTLSRRSLLLSETCENEDTAPNLIRLKREIRCSMVPTLVVPLSEYLRINNSIASKTLNDILNANYEHNNDNKLRIYIPVYRMKDILVNIRLDPRQKNCILYLDTGSDSDYSLTIIQDDLDVSLEGNQTRGYKEYFIYWEQNPEKPVILHTKTAVQYQDIIFADDVIVIVNAYDLLRYHFHMSFDFKKEFGTDDEWHQLSKAYGRAKNLEDAIKSILQVSSYSENLYENWATYTPFKRWALWLWTKSKNISGYLGKMISQSTDVDTFTTNIYRGIVTILGSSNFDQFYTQRKKLISVMRLSPTQSFYEDIKELSPVDRILCLTDLNIREKSLILLAYAEAGASNAARIALKSSYPDAYNYLEPIGFTESRLEKYFSMYRLQKLLNIISDEFLMEANEIAASYCELVWQFPARNDLIQKIYSNDAIVFFVDALGVEYVPLLLSLFPSDGYEVESNIGHCNLPSTTSHNTDFLNDKMSEKFYMLDQLKHSTTSSYPESIVTEFEYINKIRNQVDDLLTRASTVIIATDHGTSRMAVLYREKSKVYCSKENSHRYDFGRFCVDPVNDYSDIEGCIHQGDFWIFANYDRFAERGAPSCEIHGGASLEEMIVPIIKISRKLSQSTPKSNVIISVLTPSIKQTISKIVTVRFTLAPTFSDVSVIVANERIKCDYVDNKYQFRFRIRSSDHYKVKVVTDILLGEFDFNIIKGIANNNLDI